MTMSVLGKIFTWWDGATIGTLLWSKRNGSDVGEDDLGNRYFQSKDGKRRWVIYKGSNDASRVPPEWHGWLHHTHDGTPDDYLPPVKDWQKQPTANLTGSEEAYRPSGAFGAGENRARATGDYEAWSPDGA